MKISLQFASAFVLMLIHVITSNGQTIIMEEDFSGFTTGSHSSPSTNDVYLSLDSKTSVPGWTGSHIYSAGGEIKIGTSSLTGWIETPPIDLSDTGCRFNVGFDIARWPGDATTVQVYLDGIAAGLILTPSDNFQRVQISLPTGNQASKIKIQAITKRFFLDNFTATADNIPTLNVENSAENNEILLCPVPVVDILNVLHTGRYKLLSIYDLSGKLMKNIVLNNQESIAVDISFLSRGIYFLYCRSDTRLEVMKFVKY